MPLEGAWLKVWIYFGLLASSNAARPRFDTSTDMGLVLVPADAEVDSVIFRLRATDQDADFPLVFEITATITPVVRIDNLPCTLYNKVCQANVILTRRLTPGRLHDFAVRVRDTKGDSNSMQATISVTNATTSRDKIFPHIPALIMVPEDTRPGTELDYLLVRANPQSGKPVYIELWQPKELFTIRQRQTQSQTRGVITLIGELDFETQSMYTLTMYATDPYTEPGKDTRNIAGLNVVVIVQDVQDVPPIFTLAPPLTRINNSIQPGDVVLRVHAEDGDKGVPREITYGLVSEGNPFTPFFNISESTGEIVLARPLEDLTLITHVGAPVVLTVVAEELRRSTEEPPSQATVVEVGFLLGEPGNSPPYFESDNYMATIDENLEPGSIISFSDQYSTRVKDEDIGKAGVFALKLFNNNGTFEINPTVAERTAEFVISVRDNALIDYELCKSLMFKVGAQEVGPATNLSASVPVTIFIRDINDNPPVFEENSYEVTLSENVTAGTRVVQVHATDKDTGTFGAIRYTRISGQGSDAFTMDPDTGLITVAMGSSLDREIAERLQLSVEARDENGNGNSGFVPLIVNLLDVNDNAPIFERDGYEFQLNSDLSNFTAPAVIKAVDADAEPPNNEIRYELIHGNYDNKFYLNEITGELFLRSPITKIRRKKQSNYANTMTKFIKESQQATQDSKKLQRKINVEDVLENVGNKSEITHHGKDLINNRLKRASDDDINNDDNVLFTLTARAYDLGVPHHSSVAQVRIIRGPAMSARIVMFVVPGEHPDPVKTAETLATITGGRVTVQDIRPYVPQNQTGTGMGTLGTGKKSIVVARVEQVGPGTSLVDVEKIRETLAANGVGIIGGTDTITDMTTNAGVTKAPTNGNGNTGSGTTTIINNTITSLESGEVITYKAENKLLFWLLIVLGLLMLLAIAALIICCICPGCPFYMEPRKRRVHSSETLIVRADGRPKRHLYRKQATLADVGWTERKQAWSADPTRRNWQFNRRNTKNCGLASLPGDVAYISDHQNDVRVNVEPFRLQDGGLYDPSRRSRMDEHDRLYMEDVEEQRMAAEDAAEAESLQRHEFERGSDIHHQGYRYVDADESETRTVREQHFYREGNAEVLRLVTRGQVEDAAMTHHQPTTLIVDGKDILLRRFMEDQRSREDASLQELEVARSMESHQRPKDLPQPQPEVLLIPERLDIGHRSHIEEVGPIVQRLVIDHGEYDKGFKVETKESQARQDQLKHDAAMATVISGISTTTDRPSVINKEHGQTVNTQTYSFHDMELARQNALLTRLLFERESRAAVAGNVDSTSYLETQSLPGQVAIATQTDRTTATQTDRLVRSRSDNDESEDDSRHKRKAKSKKRYEADTKKMRTLWMKSPIEEEDMPCFDKRLSILRKKVKEVKEGRAICLEPGVLREISDSLDDNGSSGKGEDDEKSRRMYTRSTEQTSIRYKMMDEKEDGSPSSEEQATGKHERKSDEPIRDRKIDSRKAETMESTTSPETEVNMEKSSPKKEQNSPQKDKKKSAQKRIESVVRPSFRILEREITMLTKKLSKLGEKRTQESTGSESTSRDKSTVYKKDSKKEMSKEKHTSKRMDDSRFVKPSVEPMPSTSKISRTEESVKSSQRKESTMAKQRQKLKYQPMHVMSTGSSEYEETFEKPKKQSTALAQESKQKYSTGTHSSGKVKKQIDRKEHKRTGNGHDQDSDKGKDSSLKEPRGSMKLEKAGKFLVHAHKLGAIGRKEHVQEELGTSTSSDRVEGKRDMSIHREASKKTNSTSSDNNMPESRRSKIAHDRGKERIAVESTRHIEKHISSDQLTEHITKQLEEKLAIPGIAKDMARELHREIARHDSTDKSPKLKREPHVCCYHGRDIEIDMAQQQFSDDFVEAVEKVHGTKIRDSKIVHNASEMGEEILRQHSPTDNAATTEAIKRTPAPEDVTETDTTKQRRRGEDPSIAEIVKQQLIVTEFVEALKKESSKEQIHDSVKDLRDAPTASATSSEPDKTLKEVPIDASEMSPEKNENIVLTPDDEKIEQKVEQEEDGKLSIEMAAEIIAKQVMMETVSDMTQLKDIEVMSKDVSDDFPLSPSGTSHEDSPTTESASDASLQTLKAADEESIEEQIDTGQSTSVNLESLTTDESADRIENKHTSATEKRAEVKEDSSPQKADALATMRGTYMDHGTAEEKDKSIRIEQQKEIIDASQEHADKIKIDEAVPTLPVSVSEEKEKKPTGESFDKKIPKDEEYPKKEFTVDQGVATHAQRLVEEEGKYSKPGTLPPQQNEQKQQSDTETLPEDKKKFEPSFVVIADTIEALQPKETSPRKEILKSSPAKSSELQTAQATFSTIESSQEQDQEESQKSEPAYTVLSSETSSDSQEQSGVNNVQTSSSEGNEAVGSGPGLVGAILEGEHLNKDPPGVPSNKHEELDELHDERMERASTSGQRIVEGEGIAGEPTDERNRVADVSLDIFSSITIDTPDDSDESDSSSDISRKTTLTTRPYQTPRHRPRMSPERGNVEGSNTEDDSIEDPDTAIFVMRKEEEGYDDSLRIEEDSIEDPDTTIFVMQENEEGFEESLSIEADESFVESGASEDFTPNAQISQLSSMNDANTRGDTSIDRWFEVIASTSKATMATDQIFPLTPSRKSKDKRKPDKSKSAESVSNLPRAISSVRKESLNVRRQRGGTKSDVPPDKRAREEEVSSIPSAQKQTARVPAIKKRTIDRRTGQHPRSTRADERLQVPPTQKEKKSSLEDGSNDKTTRPAEKVHSTRQFRHRSRKGSEDVQEVLSEVHQQKSQQMERLEVHHRRQLLPRTRVEREKKVSTSGGDKSPHRIGVDLPVDVSKTQSKYMAWYTQKREETERRRIETRKEDEEHLPRWLRKGSRRRDERRRAEGNTPETTPRTRRKVKPLVNVESEQLKAIVRQGRKLRKAEGGQNEDPPVQIFASTPPSRQVPEPRHHLVQHSEYKYERMPAPFYLHPPPPAPPHPSPQMSPEHCEIEAGAEIRRAEDVLDSDIMVALPGGTRLRNQQLLDKKSVFDIAYNEAAPSQLRSDSTTPPS